LISADPITKISWATGIDPKTGRPGVNPDARYRTSPVSVMPGPSGGHVWPPWSYNPATGLVYIPGTAGGSYTYLADPNYVPQPTDVGPTGRGLMNMGTGRAGGGRGGRGRGAATTNSDAVPTAVDGATPAAPAPLATPPMTLSTIGPDGPTGNVLYAWDPIARKERWRAAGAGAGPFSGGSLSTAGNLVFSSVNDKLLAFRADTGEKLAEFETGLSQLGPPITFLIQNKQYIAVAGGPRGATGFGPAPPGPRQPAHLLVFELDGKASLPGVANQ
jgi:quinohemoprotein ethanol dehydrogenase